MEGCATFPFANPSPWILSYCSSSWQRFRLASLLRTYEYDCELRVNENTKNHENFTDLFRGHYQGTWYCIFIKVFILLVFYSSWHMIMLALAVLWVLDLSWFCICSLTKIVNVWDRDIFKQKLIENYQSVACYSQVEKNVLNIHTSRILRCDLLDLTN